MDTSLATLFNLYTFTPGRRLFAIAQVRKAALAAGDMAIAAFAVSCVDHDEALRTLEATWAAQDEKAPAFAPEAKPIDLAIDGVLVAIRDTAERQVEASAQGDPIATSGSALLKEIFPRGLFAVTSLPYVEELCEVERILGVLQHPMRVPTVQELGLSRYVARLVDLAKQYRTALELPLPKRVTFPEVKAARAEGQRRMLQLVAMIVGRYPSDTPEDQASRLAMLGPIVQQNEAIGQSLRARRTADDVDPETGEPLRVPVVSEAPAVTTSPA
ncbi:hypothetical protein [Polyangium sp. y55x31]|uniref:hypothetical protein n=1 Tax=Polyangium sp. y55x31 TaxID=3042688 RepID=UPI002482AE31|nr:hypothetical protein [Polyangium sp. y55x31]MDI1484031.1 hypothetical protein [Polyangium sp. y55x31]